MSIELIVEVLDRAPADLGAAERLLLVVLAEKASARTRECYPTTEELCRRTGLTPRGLKQVMTRLTKAGLDVRRQIGTYVDAAGKTRPLYTVQGQRRTYRVPELADAHASPTPAEGDAHASQPDAHASGPDAAASQPDAHASPKPSVLQNPSPPPGDRADAHASPSQAAREMAAAVREQIRHDIADRLDPDAVAILADEHLARGVTAMQLETAATRNSWPPDTTDPLALLRSRFASVHPRVAPQRSVCSDCGGDGWLGETEAGALIPCRKCKPHLARRSA